MKLGAGLGRSADRGRARRPGAVAGFGRARGWWGAMAAVLVLATAGGCSRPEPQTPAAQAARAQELIEAGNEAYTRGDYRLAVRRYAAATAVRKDDPAAYYGMGMALSKLGHDEEARANYARARELVQGKP